MSIGALDKQCLAHAQNYTLHMLSRGRHLEDAPPGNIAKMLTCYLEDALCGKIQGEPAKFQELHCTPAILCT